MVNDKQVIAIIQARMNSSRLPGKVMLNLGGQTILERVVNRTRKATLVDNIILATSAEPADDPIDKTARKLGVQLFRGNLDNVLHRFYSAIQQTKAQVIVRVTADNPFTEPRFIDYGIKKLLENDLDYVAIKDIPYGTGAEVFTREALIHTYRSATTADEKEHVTVFIKNHPESFKIGYPSCPFQQLSRPEIRVTIDELSDFMAMSEAVDHMQKSEVSLEELIAFIDMQKRYL